jgi:DNA-binding transcriptional LysR family regulator
VERYEIEVFLTLAANLHFGRTAERLRITTARVSQTIKKLERRVGAPLFDRTSRRVALTELGEQFHDELLPAYRQVQAALTHAVTTAGAVREPVRVGFVGPAIGHLALRAADVTRERHPDCAVELHEVQFNDAVTRLRGNDVDVLLGCLPIKEPDLVTGPPLLSEPWTLALPTGHPYTVYPSITISDLAAIPILQAPCSLPRDWYDQGDKREQPGSAPTHRDGTSAETLQEALTMVGAGRGAFPVGEHIARFHRRPDIVYIPIADAPPLRWGTVRRAGGSPGVDIFIAVVGDLVRRQTRAAPSHQTTRRLTAAS